MMELLTYKDSKSEYTYYLDSDGDIVYHGEFKSWYDHGQLLAHRFYVHDILHGEYKYWHRDGDLWDHCFFIHGKENPVIEFKTPEEKLLFLMEHPDFWFIEE